MFQAVRIHPTGAPMPDAQKALDFAAMMAEGDIAGCSYHYELWHRDGYQVYRTHPVGPVRNNLVDCHADADAAMFNPIYAQGDTRYCIVCRDSDFYLERDAGYID